MYNEVLVFTGNFNSFLLLRLNHLTFFSDFSDFKYSLYLKAANCRTVAE